MANVLKYAEGHFKGTLMPGNHISNLYSYKSSYSYAYNKREKSKKIGQKLLTCYQQNCG